MTELVLLAIAILSINVTALVLSRRGSTGRHKLAFISAVFGMCAFPICAISMFSIGMGFFTFTLQSPLSALFVTSGAVVVASTVTSLVMCFWLALAPRQHAG